MFVELPVELILIIVSFLSSVRDKIRLRCVSRKLRSICAGDIPTLWREFEWPCYEDRDREELCLQSVLKSCGEHVQLLSFPDHVPPSKLIKLLDHCRNVIQLDIPTTELHLEQVRSVLDNMKQLQKLDTKWNRETWRLLTLTFNTNLKELTVRVKMHIMSGDYGYIYANTRPFVGPIYAWVKEWMDKEFVPQHINFITSSFDTDFYTLATEMLRVWFILNRDSPPGHHGFLKFYCKKSLDLFPNIPEFQIVFGQTAVLPIAKTSDLGVLGLDTEYPWVFLTSCVHGGETVYKAACMQSCEEDVELKFVSPPTFNYLVDFDMSWCGCLLSVHLEQVAVSCPNLQRLSLRSSKKCLTSLQGLRSIASYCNNLQGLNLIGISEVEDKIQLWDVLSGMKLTHLALELCVTEPSTANEKIKMIEVYQKFVVLIAIELNNRFCDTCKSLRDKESILVAHFPSLEFCVIPDIHPMAIQDIINTCKKLKYLNCECAREEFFLFVNYCSLQELCFRSERIDIPETFMSTISAHGGLVHVVLDVNSVTSEGITALIMNSPNLLTFHIYVNCIDGLDQENLQLTLKEIFRNRKLFTTGGYKLAKEHYYEYEQHTNLLSLWNYPFWNNVGVRCTSEDTDILTLADFDKNPGMYKFLSFYW